jgi:UDP-N-acetylmuramoylalanine--D-glutamate ligase
MDNLFKNKRILVVGMGRSGVAAMEAALEQGAEVSVQDSKSLTQLSPELRKKLEGNPVKPTEEMVRMILAQVTGRG